MKRNIDGRPFSYVGLILPERDERGAVILEVPQSRFRNVRNLSLHQYGGGPFCRFRVAQGWRRSSIYVLASGNTPLYVGECRDLEERWGARGYGNISPRNCYEGGQQTNCRINNLIFQKTSAGEELTLWFHQLDGDAQTRRAVESGLVAALKPPWNK